jgi:hypothetical protein
MPFRPGTGRVRRIGRGAANPSDAAELAYQDEERVRATASDWGFDRVASFRVPHTPPLPTIA